MHQVKVCPMGKDEYFFVHESLRYSRIAAGVCLPGRLAGYCAIIGASLYPERSIAQDVYRLDLLREFQETSANRLLTRLSDAVADWEIDCIFGYLSDSDKDFLSFYNGQARRRNDHTIGVAHPPFCDDDRLATHIRILQDRLRPESKSLILGDGSQLQAALMQLQSEDIPDARAADHPVVAGAGWCVAGLTAFSKSRMKNLPQQMNTQWDNNGRYGV